MIAVLQRVTEASVSVGGNVIGSIGPGLAILLGVHQNDTEDDSNFLVEKTATLRIFNDDVGKMNHSLLDTGGSALVVSQFTLLADWRKGRSPSYTKAAEPVLADRLYRHFNRQLARKGLTVATGTFGANMEVSLVNEGPVTFVLDSRER